MALQIRLISLLDLNRPIGDVRFLSTVEYKPLSGQRLRMSKEGWCVVSHIAASHSDVAFDVESG